MRSGDLALPERAQPRTHLLDLGLAPLASVLAEARPAAVHLQIPGRGADAGEEILPRHLLGDELAVKKTRVPADQDIADAGNWLKKFGFTIDEIGHGRMWINFSGDVQKVDVVFTPSAQGGTDISATQP